MAIIKHIAMKSAAYGSSIDYLTYQHDEFTQKMIMDEYGIPLMREDFIFDGINCNPYSYDYECFETNHAFNKNLSYDEVKQHHYIISFDPKDVAECGLTGEKAQELGMEYAKKNFPGHQTLVCTHLDGHNHSGNIHVHIVFNSLRKLDVDERAFMERPCDHKAGYKHHETKKLMAYLKKDLMELCHRENLHQVDLLRHAGKRITDREYYANKRGKTRFQTQKDYLRKAIEDASSFSKNEDEFRRILEEKYHVTLKISRGRYVYLHPERSKPIRGRMLGTDYEETHLRDVFESNQNKSLAVSDAEIIGADNTCTHAISSTESTASIESDNITGMETADSKAEILNSHPRQSSDEIKLPPILNVKSNLKLVVDLQTSVKKYLQTSIPVTGTASNTSYARRIRLSNLKKMADTVAFAQEHGYNSLDDVAAALSASLVELRQTRKQLDSIREDLRSVNERIHYTGQYLATKNVYKEYLKSRNKSAFRNEHYGDIVRYEGAREYLKSHYGDGRHKSLKALKSEKTHLQFVQNHTYIRLYTKRKSYLEVLDMQKNIEAIKLYPR